MKPIMLCSLFGVEVSNEQPLTKLRIRCPASLRSTADSGDDAVRGT